MKHTPLVALTFGLLGAHVASAHIHLTAPLSRTDAATGDQKEQHCGVLNQARNPARVTTILPGATFTVTWMETIQHPGYFRIAFQPAGSIFSIPPEGATAGSFPIVDLTGMTDGAGAMILADQIPDGTLSTTITLPNIECADCTLQFIQVMTDKAPYTVDAASDDIYFNCADITLSTVVPPETDGPGTPGPDAGVDPTDPKGDLGGGCSTGGGSGSAAVLGILALVWRRRRR